MPQSEKRGNNLLPVLVIGGLVLASMFVMLMLFIFSGLMNFPLSLVALTVCGGVAILAGSLFAASLSRKKEK
jgi:uncharacterized membrane-anchored protein